MSPASSGGVCSSAFKIASSILKANGFNKVANVRYGWNKIKDCNVPIVTGVPDNTVSG